MKRAVVVIALVAMAGTTDAHVGSPDVFFEGDAGPYRLFVTIRTPQVIPGVATVEIRSEASDVTAMTVVSMRLTGPGSELPPSPDAADRSTIDPQFFTANLWLMERGSLQVRISVDGARGPATLSVPVAASAQSTLAMPAGLGTLLFALMLLLALAIVAIIAGAFREAALEPGVPARPRSRIAIIVLLIGVAGIVVLGERWWSAVAADYDRLILRPWQVDAHVDGCRLVIPPVDAGLMLDHGHEMHLFLVRMPALDRLAHLHPQRDAQGQFVHTLPSLPAGHYQLFADIVVDSGFPVTGTAALDLPDTHCDPVTGDDSTWAPGSELANGARMIWDRPPNLVAGAAQPFVFRVVERDGTPATLEPYMGMAAHAEVIRTDASVFAHLHPNGSVAMPALELAQQHGPMDM
ncbi:MAG TPA: hypothetical protein VGO00_16625, partial [Kofleriaceae bacterium]|nr:hypothetical protein [Kofleriaceae bacterium]